MRQWFERRRSGTGASKEFKEVKKCVADMIKKLEEEAAVEAKAWEIMRMTDFLNVMYSKTLE